MRHSTKVQLMFGLAQVSPHLTSAHCAQVPHGLATAQIAIMSNSSISRMFGLAKDGQNLLSSKVLKGFEGG